MKIQIVKFTCFFAFCALIACDSSKRNGTGNDAEVADGGMLDGTSAQLDTSVAQQDANTDAARDAGREVIDANIVNGSWTLSNVATLDRADAGGTVGAIVGRCVASTEVAILAPSVDTLDLSARSIKLYRGGAEGWETVDIVDGDLDAISVNRISDLDLWFDAQGDAWIAYHAPVESEVRVVHWGEDDRWHDELVDAVEVSEISGSRKFSWVRGATEATLVLATSSAAEDTHDSLIVHAWTADTHATRRRVALGFDATISYLDAHIRSGVTHITFFEQINFDLLHVTIDGGGSTYEAIDVDGTTGIYARLFATASDGLRVAYSDVDADAVRTSTFGTEWVRQTIATHERIRPSSVLWSFDVDSTGRSYLTWNGGTTNTVRYVAISGATRHDERLASMRQAVVIAECDGKTWYIGESTDHRLTAGYVAR